MKWCCIGFESLCGNAGERAFAAIGCRDQNQKPIFYLQYRAVESGAQLSLSDDVPVTLMAQTGLTFCPSCGVKLEKFYRASIDEMKRPDLVLGLTKDRTI